MEQSQRRWITQTFLLYAPFFIEFGAYPLFMLITPEWLGGLLFWVLYTFVFYGAAIIIHTRWRTSIGMQNVYYAFEFTLIACIVDCAQRTAEKLGANANIPWGGLFLGLTWGLGHAITKGVFAYGLASMMLSVIAGFLYIKLGRRPTIAWAFVAAAYLL